MASTSTVRSNMITRRRKRDLETTMKSLKKLLEPNTGSRKKNIPRSLAKVPKKTRTINRIENYENSSDDGEYYPNKLKRKDQRKKILLKPNHSLKIVVATNKRKRATPVRGLQTEDRADHSNIYPAETNKIADKNSTIKPSFNEDSKLQALTIQPVDTVSKYELVSPPHRSLTELTVDDLMRMDEDSLSEDDFMEVLTCPSPVWWEEPPDDFKEGVLYVEKPDNRKENSDNSMDSGGIINLNIKTEPKIPALQKNDKKMKKLEHILGNIKSRVENNSHIIDKTADNDSKMNENMKNINENISILDRDDPDGTVDSKKQRKISSSGSDISVNDDDLLRNLENITIPILNIDTDNIKQAEDTNDSNNLGKISNVAVIAKDDIQKRVSMSAVSNKTSKSCESAANKKIHSKKYTKGNKCKKIIKIRKQDDIYLKPRINYKKVKNTYTKKGQIISSKSKQECDKTAESEPEEIRRNKEGDMTVENIQKTSIKTDELTTSSVLKQDGKDCNVNLTDDILDVRLIKTPTNTSNVKIWSKIDNFKPHNLKNEDFIENFDIENELQFSLIKSKKFHDKLNSETICIDDDEDDVQIKQVKNVCNRNDNSVMSQAEMVEITSVDVDKHIVNEETITVNKHLNVRLIKTEIPKHTIIEPQYKLNNNKCVKQYTNNKSKKIINQVGMTTQRNDVKVIRINDVDISLVKPNEKSKNTFNEINNDLCITLVKKNKVTVNTESNKKSNAFIIYPKHTESPKSINSTSLSSERNELSEGTVLDTNTQLLDNYDVGNKTDNDIQNKSNTNTKSESLNENCELRENINKNITRDNAVDNSSINLNKVD